MTTIGSIQSLSGKFFAQDANGNIRELQVGDQITQGERVFGDNSNIDTDKIEILSQDGGLLSFLGNQSHILDFSSVDSTFGNEEVAFKEESVWNAMDDESAIELAEGEETAAGDESILEEETAAGDEGPTSSDSGVFSFNSRDGGSVDVGSSLRNDSFASGDDSEINEEFVNSAPVVFNVDVTQNEVLDGYNIISGQLSVTDADANDTHTFFAVAGSLSVTTPDGVEMNDVTFVFNPDGSYTISGDFNALAFGENAVVSFQYYAVDNVGNSSQIATLALTVVGTNDQPVVSDINANGEGVGEGFIGLDKLETTGTYEEGYLPSYRTWGQTFVAESDSLAKIDFNINDSYDNGIDSEVRVVIVSTDSFINDPATAWHPTTFGGNVVFEQNISLSFGSNNIVTVDTSGLNLAVGQQYQVILYHIGGDPFNIYYSASGNVDDGIALTEISNTGTGSGYIHGGYNMGITLTYGDGQTIVYESAGEIGTTDSDIYTTFEGNLATVQDDDTTDTHTYHLVNDTLAVNSSNIDPTLIEGLNVVVNEDGSYSITGDFNALATGETATVTFQYVADDGQGFDGTDGIHESSISEPATVTLTITGTNDQPVVSDINVGGIGSFGTQLSEEHNIVASGEGTIGYSYFTVTQTTTVTITTDGPTIDPVLYLLRDDGNLSSDDYLASNDDGHTPAGSFNNSIITITLQPGNYIAAVSDYSLSLNEVIAGINDTSSFGNMTGVVALNFSSDKPIILNDSNLSIIYEAPEGLNTFEGSLATAQDDDVNDTHTYSLVGIPTVNNDSVSDLDVVVNDDGTYTVTGDFNALAVGETATVTFQYVADDGKGFDGTDGIHESSISEPATVTLTITGTNDAPVAVDDEITVEEDVPFTSSVSLLANDYDIDGDNISAVAGIFETLQGGTIVITEDGHYTYTPPTNYSGTDSVTYTVTDGDLTDTGILSINVTPISDAPNLVMSISNKEEILGDNLVVNGSFEDISGIDRDGNTVPDDYDIPNGGLVYRIEIPGWKLDTMTTDKYFYNGASSFVDGKPSTSEASTLFKTQDGFYGIDGNSNNDSQGIDKNETLLFDLKISTTSAIFELKDASDVKWTTYDSLGNKIDSGNVQGQDSIAISLNQEFQYVEFTNNITGGGNVDNGFYVKPSGEFSDMPAMEPHHYNHAGVGSTDGDNYMDLGASPGNTSIYQTFETLEAGKTYKLTVDFRDKAAMQEPGQSGRDSGVMQVLWNGAIVATILGDNVEAWNTLELDLVAQIGTNKLTFREIGESDDNWGMAIDNVQLVEVIGFSYDLNINATLTDESESLTPVTLLGSTLPAGANLFIGGELLEADDNGNYIIEVESGVSVVVNLQTSTELNLEEINSIEGSVTSQEVVDSVVVDEVITTSTAFNEVDINPDGSATGTDGDDLFKIAGDDYDIDGGDGDDMLQLVSGYSIDFSGLSTFKNIEQIDLSATGSNALNNLSANDVLEMTDDGNEIVITGTSEDSVNLIGTWSVSSSTEGFKSYTSTADGDETVTLHIQDDIDVNTI